MKVVQARGIEGHLILHGRSAESGVVRDSGDAAIGALDNPILNRVKLLRRAVLAADCVAIDQAAGAEERRHAGRDALGELRIAETLEYNLARKIRIGSL